MAAYEIVASRRNEIIATERVEGWAEAAFAYARIRRAHLDADMVFIRHRRRDRYGRDSFRVLHKYTWNEDSNS